MMMAMDGRIRMSNRRSWPRFLSRMAPPCVWRAWFGQGDEKQDDRTRLTGEYIVPALMFMGCSAQGGFADREKTHLQWWMTWPVHLPSLLPWDSRQGSVKSCECGLGPVFRICAQSRMVAMESTVAAPPACRSCETRRFVRRAERAGWQTLMSQTSPRPCARLSRRNSPQKRPLTIGPHCAASANGLSNRTPARS